MTSMRTGSSLLPPLSVLADKHALPTRVAAGRVAMRRTSTACFTNRPPVFTNCCWRLVSDQFSLLLGSRRGFPFFSPPPRAPPTTSQWTSVCSSWATRAATLRCGYDSSVVPTRRSAAAAAHNSSGMRAFPCRACVDCSKRERTSSTLELRELLVRGRRHSLPPTETATE